MVAGIPTHASLHHHYHPSLIQVQGTDIVRIRVAMTPLGYHCAYCCQQRQQTHCLHLSVLVDVMMMMTIALVWVHPMIVRQCEQTKRSDCMPSQLSPLIEVSLQQQFKQLRISTMIMMITDCNRSGILTHKHTWLQSAIVFTCGGVCASHSSGKIRHIIVHTAHCFDLL